MIILVWFAPVYYQMLVALWIHVAMKPITSAANLEDQFLFHNFVTMFQDFYTHTQGMTLSGNICQVELWYRYVIYFRPFGCSLIFSSWLDGKPELWTLDPSGAAFGYRGAAAGKAKNNARTEIEKLDFDTLTVEEGLKHAARIIHSVHDEVKGNYSLELAKIVYLPSILILFRSWFRTWVVLGDTWQSKTWSSPGRRR